MRLIFRIFLLTVSYTFIAAGMVSAASAPASVKRGNNLYRQGKYDEALKYYNEAETDRPGSGVVNFNKGTAFYRKGDYQKAIEAFSKALLSDDPRIEEKAAYNIGNSNFRAGKLKENTELASAIALYRQALDYYKRAIELDRNDADAKYNHEFVEKELKVLLDKLKQQQKQSQQNNEQKKKQEEKQKQEQAKTQQRKEEEEEKERGRKQEQARAAASGQEEKGQEQKQQEAAQGEKKEGEQKGQKEMSEEEARMVLDRYDQQDQPAGTAKREAGSRRYPAVLKDW